MRGRKVGETSGTTLGIKEPCPNSTLRTPLPQQSSSSVREEEDHWELREERRRRRIAFENVAKSMLRCLDNWNEVKVGITELQELVEVPAHITISSRQVAQQAMNEDGQQKFEVFWEEEGALFVASWDRWEAQRKFLVDLGRRCQDISHEIQMLIKDKKISRVQSKASSECKTERVKDCKIKSLKKYKNWNAQRQKKPCK